MLQHARIGPAPVYTLLAALAELGWRVGGAVESFLRFLTVKMACSHCQTCIISYYFCSSFQIAEPSFRVDFFRMQAYSASTECAREPDPEGRLTLKAHCRVSWHQLKLDEKLVTQIETLAG